MSDFEFDYEQEIARLKAENDRMRAELFAYQGSDAQCEAASDAYEAELDAARADLARALPVVEAAGAVESWWERHADKGSSDADAADLLDALTRAYRAARELQQ